jgi:hypothetical protein
MISSNFAKELESTCEECDQSIASLHCDICEQNLCSDCDKRIHNKGSRKSHKRVLLVQQSEQEEVQSISVVSEVKHDISLNATIDFALSHSREDSRAVSIDTVVFSFNGQNNNDECYSYTSEQEESSTKEPAQANLNLLVDKLYELAREGDIMLEVSELRKVMKGLKYEMMIEEGKSKDKILVIERNVGTELKQQFVSLKLQEPSHETLMWILKSLEKDAMVPIQEIILRRYKESFGVKMKTKVWNKFWETVKNSKLRGKDGDYVFDVLEIEDVMKTKGTKINSIYPKGYRWKSYDMSLRPADINQRLYKEAIDFLESCFLNKSDKNYLKEERCPGGRYGCARFIKTCGPSSLRKCPLGQLIQFVKVAEKGDIVKHDKTYLTWINQPSQSTSNPKIKKEQEERSYKLELVKIAIIEVLTENIEGIRLSQLRLSINDKLSFSVKLDELKFLKFKDLLNTMNDQVAIEIREKNELFAKLINNEQKEAYVKKSLNEGLMVSKNIDFNGYLETIKVCIYNLLLEYPLGIDANYLRFLVYSRIGMDLDYTLFGCSNLRQFIEEYIIASYQSIEIININPYDHIQFILKHKFPYCEIKNTEYPACNTLPPHHKYPARYFYDTNPKVNTVNKEPLEHPSISSNNLSTTSSLLCYFSTSSAKLHCLLFQWTCTSYP